MKNGDKIGEKSGKNRGWLVMMLGVLFQGPGWISKKGILSMFNNNKNSRKKWKEIEIVYILHALLSGSISGSFAYMLKRKPHFV
jgi:hypothetical protein